MKGLGILAALLVAFAVSACGSEQSAAPVPPDAVALAASKTTDAGSYKADMTATVEAAGQSVQMRGTGSFDGEARRGHMSLTTSVAGQDFDMDMVFALPVMYMRLPSGLMPGLPPGKSWVKLDFEQLGHQAGFDLGQLMQAGQADPSQGLDYLRGATDIQEVGREDVRGVPTTHYKGVVELRRVADQFPELQPSVERLIQQTGIDRVPVEVWVGDDNLVRRMRQSYEGAQVGPGASMDMTSTVELYDFGTKVDVSPPPADETVDLSQLIGQS